MKDNPLFSDALNLFNSGVGFMAELQQQIMQDFKERVDEKIDKLDLVKKADLDRLEKMVKELQAEVKSLKNGVAEPASKEPVLKKTTLKKKPVKKATQKPSAKK